MARRLLAVVVLGSFFYITLPLLMPLMMGVVFAVLFFPALKWLERKRLNTSMASGLVTLGITLLILLPGTFLIFISARTGLRQLRTLRAAPQSVDSQPFFDHLLHSGPVQLLLEKITRWFPIQIEDLRNSLEDLAASIGLKLADALGAFFAALPTLTMGLAVLIVSIYFFLVDGRRIVGFMRRNSFLSPLLTERMLGTFYVMCRSVILATVVSGLVQAVCFSIACIIVGFRDWPLVGFLVFLASFIPLIGSAPITFGLGIYHLLAIGRGEGIFLIAMAVFIGVVDNFIRPLVLKGAGNLHPLLAFVAAFGGLQVMGFAGVFLGPILAALFVVTLEDLVERRPADL